VIRKLFLLSWLAASTLQAFAAKAVTVEQLEELLEADHGKPDAKLAQQIATVELGERLSAPRLSLLEVGLPGPESQRALMLIADQSAFLELPATEIPATAKPDIPAQHRIVSLAVSYVSKTIRELPNFFATRDTIRFEDTPEMHRPDMSLILYQALHSIGRSSETVLYRDGEEVIDSGAVKGKKSESVAQGLTTSGVFGTILARVLVDAGQGKLAWSHWEQGAAGPLAVFRYAVPSEKSRYEVQFCCVPVHNESRVFRKFSGYHGVIAIDPVNGSILRLTVEADLRATDPIMRSDILVEYAPIEIGGKKYVCPVKSVSITLAPVQSPNATAMSRYRGEVVDTNAKFAPEHLQTLLNDVVFTQYHMFRSNVRVLTDENARPDSTKPISH